MAKGLGNGLGALFGDEAMTMEDALTRLPIAKIEPRPDQPRQYFDEEKLEELASSIREHGVLQPVTVRETDPGYYQIIAGERRWRAARLAGLSEIPVNIVDVDDREAAEIALIENLQREDLNPVEEARGYEKLMSSYGLTQEQVAERVGKSRPAVTNSIRLLKLSPVALGLTEEGKLSMSQARALLELTDATAQEELAKRAAEGEMSVREIGANIKRLNSGGKSRAKKNYRLGPDGIDYTAEVERELTQAMGRKVSISAGRAGGRITLEYYSDNDLEYLRRALKAMKSEWEL